jgi:DNA-binding NarL/FixJ family response regulator
MTSRKKKRIIIVEDHPMVRERLSELVRKEAAMDVCAEAEDAEQGLALIRQLKPDLAIVDITLNDSNGLDLIKALRDLSLNTPVLILSMHDEELYAQRAVRAGASGYIMKSAPSSEVVAAVRKVLGGELYLSPAMTSMVLRNTLTPTGPKKQVANPLERLTDREIRVLEMIGEGYKSRAIADALKVGVTTVDTYRTRIKEKLEFENTFELQHFAIKWLWERK